MNYEDYRCYYFDIDEQFIVFSLSFKRNLVLLEIDNNSIIDNRFKYFTS
jgi:hypothetical protein